jgi:hypothetical protein
MQLVIFNFGFCEFQVSLNEQSTILTCPFHQATLGFVSPNQNCLLFFPEEELARNKMKKE